MSKYDNIREIVQVLRYKTNRRCRGWTHKRFHWWTSEKNTCPLQTKKWLAQYCVEELGHTCTQMILKCLHSIENYVLTNSFLVVSQNQPFRSDLSSFQEGQSWSAQMDRTREFIYLYSCVDKPLSSTCVPVMVRRILISTENSLLRIPKSYPSSSNIPTFLQEVC